MIKITGQGDQSLLMKNVSGLLLALLASCFLVLAAFTSHSTFAAHTPPTPTTSRYMQTVDPITLNKLGCKQSSESGVIVLDFGQPWYQNGTYGALHWPNPYPFASTSQIATAAESFLQGRWDCMTSGSTTPERVTLAIGTNNYQGYTTYNHGQAWALMVDQVNSWIVSKGYNTYEAAAGADDMELGYNSAANTRAWADGYASDPNHAIYYDYGDAGGCPPYGSCNNGWTQADVIYVSWDVQSAFPLPQIYYRSQADEWYQLALYSHNNPGPKGPMLIQGVLTEYAADRTTNTPSQGWTELWNSLNANARTAQTPLYSSDITWDNKPGTVNPPALHQATAFDLRYVTNLYHDILGRIAIAADINGAAQSIANGSSRAQVANGFLMSQEYHTNLVNADFQQMLHRAVDASGTTTFVTLLSNGAKNEDVLTDLAASDEYFSTRAGGTNGGFVNALYQDLVQRAADPSGLANWTHLLDSGAASRADVARGMIRSQEYRTKLVDGYYSHYLARSAYASGESHYVSVLTQGGTDESVIAGLVSSDEYYAK